MQKLFTIFKWFILVSILILSLLFTNYRQSVQNIKLNNITIYDSHDNFLNKKILLKYIQAAIDNLDTGWINFNNIEKLENILQSHNAIRNVEVFANPKGQLNILVKQKVAIVRISSNNGDYYLDEFGERMQLSGNYSPNLIVATGDISFKDHYGLYNFVNMINESDFWNAQITQVHFEESEIFLIPRVGSQKINIGNFDNIDMKLDNLYRFYKEAIPVKGWQTYSEINLKFNNQIVCTKNNQYDRR